MGEIDRIAEILHKHKQDPRYLLAILLDIQESENCISIEAMRAAAEYLGVSESRVFAVVTFYRTLSQKKKGRRIIRVCTGTACHLRGSAAVLQELEKQLAI
ncbi:MAG: NAD(P)H-dependent oxidoreductase subunit E, partial [Synergistaceae bacterium]